VIVHEACRTGGVGAEIAAQLAEKASDVLLSPVQRVTGYDCPMPYYKNEYFYIPSVQRIRDAVEIVLA
jgi:2-oxoisovalerate dehydrogenase E1 component beta subunit